MGCLYSYDDPSFFGGPQPAEGEDEDSYAQRIWEEMTRRKQSSHYTKTSNTGVVCPLSTRQT